MRLKRVPYDEGDAPHVPPPSPFAPDPFEQGKERTEYPGGARSSILASSPAGCSQVSVSSMLSRLLFWMKVDISDLLQEVPTDLALKRQTRSVFPAKEEPRGMWSSCLWGGRSGALSEEAVRPSRSLSGEAGGTYGSGVREESWTEMVSLARQADDRGLESWKSITKTDDHFDLPLLILTPSSRSAWLSGHVSRNAEMW